MLRDSSTDCVSGCPVANEKTLPPTCPLSTRKVGKTPCRPWWVSGSMFLAAGLSPGDLGKAGGPLQTQIAAHFGVFTASLSSRTWYMCLRGLPQWWNGENDIGSCSKGGAYYFSNSFTEGHIEFPLPFAFHQATQSLILGHLSAAGGELQGSTRHTVLELHNRSNVWISLWWHVKFGAVGRTLKWKDVEVKQNGGKPQLQKVRAHWD